MQGKKLTAGEYVGELLTWLAKKGPAAGIVLVLATQRPDSKTIPSGLRAVLGSRFALRVMDWRDSNIVLGEQMNTRGYDSSRLLASHKGVGILRPDGDTQAGAEVLALTVRTYYMPIGPVAFYGRCSTEDNQDPETSHAWQLSNAQKFVEPL